MEVKFDKYSGRPRTLRDEFRECYSASTSRIIKHSPVRGFEGMAGRVSGSAVPIYQETCLSDLAGDPWGSFDFAGDVVARDISEAVDRNELYSD